MSTAEMISVILIIFIGAILIYVPLFIAVTAEIVP